ncbi:MBOAT family protein [Butyrivibrio sp. CB08]|uniref:MBOAT family O-acyltransferase n=1 Tax=Butyrivibrio sp. CB08 TaxID=2364879 RepID=UPI000EA9E3ED|nr:MBOAT family O-acyltransferase [Butyrivibrio sp. CB08]RKM59804.1 MBOAT family protein [Butyrivibrio sp. CB08]
MQFNSFIFILCFLPLTLAGYFGLNSLGKKKLSQAFLLIMSLWFYGYFNASYLLVICGSIIVNFLISRAFKKVAETQKKGLLILGIVFNVSLIFYFKYFDFFISNINTAFGSSFALRNIVLPLGISFFTFQQISFIVDSYRGETGDYSFLEYALFVSYFPQLVAGPIVLHSELIPQFRDDSKRKVDFDNLSKGIMLFSRGLAKKVLIADTFGTAVTWGFSHANVFHGEEALGVYEIIIVMLSYTFQIYFDFSGYSDMATGLGSMFNFSIPMNFNSPYKALSVADFWKRWHMTLTRFLTQYIYIPLGGNRKGKVRTYINIMIVFLVSGIWHGANWTFILWGIIHGLGQCFNRVTSGFYKKFMDVAGRGKAGFLFTRVIHALQWAVTFAFVNVAWLLFRADSVTQWWSLLKRMTVPYYEVRSELLDSFRIPKLSSIFEVMGVANADRIALKISLYAAMAVAFVLCLCFKNNYERQYKKSTLSLVFTLGIFVVSVLSLSRISTFLYFNF